MNHYEIIYYNTDGSKTKKETDFYAIFEVNEDNTKIRIRAQTLNGKLESLDKSYCEWFKNINTGYEKTISDEELFTLCL